MEIYIGNLSKKTVVSELHDFFRGFGRVGHFRILEKVLAGGRTVRFGHGVIEPDWAAAHAIRRLNGKELHGRPVRLREYVHRTLGEDQRSGDRRERRRAGRIRRVRERRREGRFRPVPSSWR